MFQNLSSRRIGTIAFIDCQGQKRSFKFSSFNQVLIEVLSSIDRSFEGFSVFLRYSAQFFLGKFSQFLIAITPITLINRIRWTLAFRVHFFAYEIYLMKSTIRSRFHKVASLQFTTDRVLGSH